MQMPISSASPSPAPAAGSAPSTKGTEGGNFNQAFVQTMAGTQGKETNAQTDGETAAAPASAVASNSLSSLLDGNLSAADLLSAIGALLKQLDDADSEELSKTTTDSNLADALQQLDNLLSVLTGVPPVQQPTLTGPADTQEGNSSSDNLLDKGGALLAALANMNAAARASIQPSETAVPGQTGAVITNPEELNALKAGLQEALTDLRTLLQNQKVTPANRDQLALIGKELTSVEKLISGKTAASSEGTFPDRANAAGIVDSVRSMQTTPQSTVPQANSHLQRLANQLLHAGMLNVVRKPEEQSADTALTQLAADPNETNPLAVGVSADIQRQLAVVPKTVIAQPVPVQQFASTIQGLVVKQFNVSTGGNGVSQAQLTLYPEHLGQVNVNISLHNGTLTAQFVTDTVSAKDMLENQMAQLRTALQSQGLQVDKLVVSQATVQGNMFQDRQGHQGHYQETAKRNKSQDDVIDDIDFMADLEELSTQQAVDRDLGFGRGIHTIA